MVCPAVLRQGELAQPGWEAEVVLVNEAPRPVPVVD